MATTPRTLSGSTPLRIVTVLLAGEMIGIAALGSWLLVGTLAEGGEGLTIGLSSALFVIIAGLGVGMLAVGVLRARGWTRGPVAFSQFMLLPIGWQYLAEPTTPAGMTAIGAAIAVLVLLFLPSSSRAFGISTSEAGDAGEASPSRSADTAGGRADGAGEGRSGGGRAGVSERQSSKRRSRS